MMPCSTAVRADVQTIGSTWHKRRHACELLITVNQSLQLFTIDEIIVVVATRCRETVLVVVGPSHVPVVGHGSMEEYGVALVAEHQRHRTVVGSQNVLAANSRL